MNEVTVPLSAASSELKLKHLLQMSQGPTRSVLPSTGTHFNLDLERIAQIKEEPEEQSVEQQREQPPVSASGGETQEDPSLVPHFPLKTERDSVLGAYPDDDDTWRPLISPTAQTETDADGVFNQFQIRDKTTAVQNSALCFKYKSAPETSERNDADMSERKILECPFCQKRFECKMNLKRHLRVHTGERPYSCLTCQKTFTYKGNLDAHSRVHTGERPFSCSICNKTFAHRFSLKEHMKTHTNEKPYSCSICEKTFAHKGNLTTHMRTHTNEKPYKCSLCERSFALKNTLDIHTRQHTGEKPFRCSLCDKEFYQSSHLYKHMKIYHTNRNQC